MSNPIGMTTEKRSRRGVVIALLALGAIAVTALAPRCIAYVTPVTDDYGGTEWLMNSSRATTAATQLQAYVEQNGPPPGGGTGTFLDKDEKGITYFVLGSVYIDNEVVCHSPEPLKLGTPTRYGVVRWCKTIKQGYYWMILKT